MPAPQTPAAPHELRIRAPGRDVFDPSAAGASSLRRDILVQLRREGPSSPEHIATALHASRTGVLQQLRSLESAGLVDRRTVRHRVGRPRPLYDLTPTAQGAFPSNYDALAPGLIA